MGTRRKDHSVSETHLCSRCIFIWVSMLLNNDYDVIISVFFQVPLTVSNLLTFPPLPLFPCSTIVYELVTLEHPFSTLPLHSLVWQVGQGDTQSLTKLPKGRFKSITAQCWRENPALRPTFDDILTTIEQNVSELAWVYKWVSKPRVAEL